MPPRKAAAKKSPTKAALAKQAKAEAKAASLAAVEAASAEAEAVTVEPEQSTTTTLGKEEIEEKLASPPPHPVPSTSTKAGRAAAKRKKEDDLQEDEKRTVEEKKGPANHVKAASPKTKKAVPAPAPVAVIEVDSAVSKGTKAQTQTRPPSTEERLAKMKELRQRMTESAQANRRDLITETTAARNNARTLAKLERKRKQVEAMGEKIEAQETGEDLERKKAWEYSIEDNERWDKKVARKGRRADFTFTDYDDIARRKYKKDMDVFKPDMIAYNKQRAAASASTALITSSTNSSSTTSKSSTAALDLYRDANSFIYADHKPSEDAIDRVIGKINLDLDKRQKRSRERKNEDEGDITYINEKNKHFNKKLDRFYSAHTKDIRDSFERGTAL